MKAIMYFIDYLQFMSQKFLEYKNRNDACVVEITKLVEYLSKEKMLSRSIYSQEAFWPQSLPTTFDSYESTSINEVEMDVELLPRRFCGRKADAPLVEFIPRREVVLDKFIAMWPLDEDVVEGSIPIWVTKVAKVKKKSKGLAQSFKHYGMNQNLINDVKTRDKFTTRSYTKIA
ncbi:hypothetical protein O6H91_21G008600 [Diphasiastrum complanatum]|uniref:Uncharacterized protein n=1 Tax=Diphasiastrum complanatum TaxID=34168 RepID=A0ACC2AHL3_DIPCM|nr:hypothetical protein O6H91_21G008600 [Diphasiastrum complanatum]